MIALWMLYAATVAALAAVAAAAVERLLRLWQRPARLAWALALLATVAAPVALLVAPRLAPRPPATVVAGPLVTLGAEAAPAVAPSGLERLGALAAGALDGAARLLAPLDRPLLALWAGLSALAAAALLTSAAQLRRRRRAWRAETVDGVPVLVAADAGPAVMGSGTHRIVLPSWALALDAPLRGLVLRHETEHLRAGDPRLLLAGVLAVVLMPWSPAVWWQVRRLRLAVELDCDRRVLRAGGDVERYGLLLLAVSQRGGGMLRLAMPALSEGTTDLERRIAAMTSPAPRRRWARAVPLAAAAAGLVAAACVVPSPNTVSGPEARPPATVTTSNAPPPAPAPAAAPAQRSAPPVVDAGQTFFEFQVEQPVAPRNNVAPQYPADLRAAGVSGHVIAQFVVDTTGRADVTTFKAIESSDAGFTAAVLDALPAMQFTAAEIGGRKVKQLVQQAFAFAIDAPLRAPGAPPQSDIVAPRAGVMTPLGRRTDPTAAPRAGARRPAAAEGAFFEFQIEQPARALAVVTPIYPAALRAEGVRGQVIAQVVIDTTGAPVMTSFRAIESAHPLFTAAARDAIAATRFSPARVEGKAVRQLIQQAFSFAVDR